MSNENEVITVEVKEWLSNLHFAMLGNRVLWAGNDGELYWGKWARELSDVRVASYSDFLEGSGFQFFEDEEDYGDGDVLIPLTVKYRKCGDYLDCGE